jgi:hypothetical protein
MLIEPKRYAKTLFLCKYDTHKILDELETMHPEHPTRLAFDVPEYRDAVLSELGRLEDEAAEWAIVMHEAQCNA